MDGREKEIFAKGGLVTSVKMLVDAYDFITSNPVYEDVYDENDRRVIELAMEVLARGGNGIMEELFPDMVKRALERDNCIKATCITVKSLDELKKALGLTDDEPKDKPEDEYRIIG